jgi:hypothetical protein
MRTLYSEIRTQLEAEISGVHVRLWNNQLQLSEEGQQIPFSFPAVFIDFPTIEWAQMGKGVQNADRLIIRFYICYSSFHTDENEEDLEVFTLRENVFLALQDYKPTSSGKLQRIAEQTDPRHTNVYVWVMDYQTNFQETEAQYPRGGVTAEIETLTLDTDLIIDAGTVEGIRTDSEFPE